MIKKAFFLGSKKFGFEILKAIYHAEPSLNLTILCPADFKDARTYFNKFQLFADEVNLCLLVKKTPQEVLQYAEKEKPDIIFVCGYYRILPPELLAIIPCGVWGVHNSLLPKYRGGSPLVWQIINNEKKLGSSLFKFSNGIDDGPVLEQVAISNEPGLTIKEATERIEKKWLEKIPEIWTKLCMGEVNAKDQNHHEATYCAQRQNFDGQIDWKDNATNIDCFIRAQASPYPQAFFYLNDRKVKVLEHAKDNRIVFGTAGQIFEVSRDCVTICCGNNTVIRLLKLEIDGEIIIPSREHFSINQRIKPNQ